MLTYLICQQIKLKMIKIKFKRIKIDCTGKITKKEKKIQINCSNNEQQQ